MIDPLSSPKDFNQLSLQDLLAARDLYHVHLVHKENVIATAIGRYLIRKSDPWPRRSGDLERSAGKRRRQSKGKRTLDNSEVRPYSWPCILVFVKEWVDRDRFGGNGLDPSHIVPPALYMPDGRVVPVCVVEAPLQEAVSGEVEVPVFPDTVIGGGYPALIDVQGQEHVASLGCLVTDGHLTYALTSHHVTGPAGTPVYTRLNGEKVQIGVSSGDQITRLRFADAYEGWPGKDVFLNLDIGLIEIADLNRWTAQIYRIGQIGKLADLSPLNMSLRLIGCPVRAYGCVSRELRGQIHALFYRYKSVGGFEYVADFLIGARPGKPFVTSPGDSGTVWLLDTGDTESGPMPLAVQWGGHVFLGSSGRQEAPYAMASCLSTACNLLEVDVIRDWNLDRYLYWGEMGHYTIGAKACELVDDPQLSPLMMANQDRVGFRDEQLSDEDQFKKSVAHYSFVPLSDVADDVWRDIRPSDENNHFADMDQPADSGPHAGKTLMDLFDESLDSVDWQVWTDFYQGVSEPINPGALPFRVWQIWNAMVGYLAAPEGPDVTSFVCAAGCLAHYVGDACQPLHVSRLHHGNPPIHKGSVAYKIHAAYETDLLNQKAPDIVQGLNQRIQAWKAGGAQLTADIETGKGAAVRVIQLMKQTFQSIPPADLVATYNQGNNAQDRLDRMWNDFGEKTMDNMLEGCRCLAEIWQSAWKVGLAKAATQDGLNLGAIDPDDLKALYLKADFLPSTSLDKMGPFLT